MTMHNAINPGKLIHITGDSCFGGAGRIILRLGQIAQTAGWQVDILTTDPIFQRIAPQHGLGLVDLDVIRREIRPLWDMSGLVKLASFLRRERYGFVHTHTSKAGFIGRLAARMAGVPAIIHTVHGFAFHECSPQSSRLFYSGLEGIASKFCDRMVSVSEFHRRWAIELGICRPSKILAIPNGIAPLTEPKLPRIEVRRELGVRNRDLMILTLARLAPDKGIQFLIESAPLLLRVERAIQIVIAGDGPMRSQLEQQARKLGVSDWVTFLGFREDVSELLSACDVVALPSMREGLSIALLEAMASEKPLIVTNIGSHAEVASQAEIARLVPPGDPQALAEAILELASDPTLRARLGANAKVLFHDHYTEQTMLNTYKRLYFDLLQEKFPALTFLNDPAGHFKPNSGLTAPKTETDVC
jgi:glycosyltransferase involved in cell wall biosynthesis